MDVFGIIKIINIAGIIQGLILSAAIFHARTKGRKCLVFLSMLILVYSIGNLANIIVHNFFREYYWHRFLLIPFFAAIGPVFYFYIANFTGYNARIPKIFHFISILLIVAGFIVNMITKTHDAGRIDIVDVVITFAIGIQVITYSVLSILALVSYKKNIREYFSSVDKSRVLWLRFFIGVSFISWISLLIIEYSHYGEDSYGVFWLIISVIIYAVGYIGIKQPEILEYIETEPKKKYEKTAIDPEKLKEYELKLSSAVKENVFLDPDISLPSLAGMIGIHSYQLSQLINEKGMNFYEFINRMRIDYAKDLILNNNEILNIARVAFDSGYNSISAFNSAFKKFTGITPTDFAKKNSI